jgi:hypothetical protein
MRCSRACWPSWNASRSKTCGSTSRTATGRGRTRPRTPTPPARPGRWPPRSPGPLPRPAPACASAPLRARGPPGGAGRPGDGPLLVHAEDPQAIAEAPPASGRRYAGFLASRPAEAEHRAVARVIEAARRTGGRAHVLHLSSAGALDLLATARRDGVAVSAETCPHYLTFEAGSIPDGATQLKCCPPIRDARNRERPWRGLADGLIDLVASDHSPARPSSSTSTAATSARPGAASPPSS